MLAGTVKGCGIEDFAGFWVGEAFLQKSDFLAARVIGQGLDHAAGAGSNYGSIQRMVAIAFSAHFGQPPACA